MKTCKSKFINERWYIYLSRCKLPKTNVILESKLNFNKKKKYAYILFRCKLVIFGRKYMIFGIQKELFAPKYELLTYKQELFASKQMLRVCKQLILNSKQVLFAPKHHWFEIEKLFRNLMQIICYYFSLKTKSSSIQLISHNTPINNKNSFFSFMVCISC